MSFPSSGDFAVLDLETAPDEALLAFGDRRSRSEAGGRAALHSINQACLLLFRIDDGGCFSDLSLRSFGFADLGEGGILEGIDQALATVAATSGGLITFNGRAHDVPMLSRRAASRWLFRLANSAEWQPRDRHLDLMTDASWCTSGKWANLVDSCAALGIDATPLPPRATRSGRVEERIKCEVDVVSTFLLALHDMSARAGSPAIVTRGWDALATYLTEGTCAPHLLVFARHPCVAAARRLIPSLASGAR